MSVLSFVQCHYFKKFSLPLQQNRLHANECQQNVLSQLISKGKNTDFGAKHHFKGITHYDDFKKNVPLRHYNDFVPFIEKILNHEPSVLWPGLPSFFGKSSGTTETPKLLPVTNDFLSSTQFAAGYILWNMAEQLHHTRFMGRKAFYLTDQQRFEEVNGFLCGAISAIKAHRIPNWLRHFTLPGKEVNNIQAPALRVEATINSIKGSDIRMAVALPVYLSHFLKQYEQKAGNTFKQDFPGFSVLFLSGMNYRPYENFLRQHMGDNIYILENYSATEGSFAYQVVPNERGMELICNQGIFYEFIPLSEADKKEPLRLQLSEVETGVSYSMIISSNSGLWAYVMNDIVEFVSVQPYRIIFNGRLKDIFSPFGEHMLPIQAEEAITETCRQTNETLVYFMLVPDFNYNSYRYKCYAEFDNELKDGFLFRTILHEQLCKCNSYIDDLAKVGAFIMPELITVNKGFFHQILSKTTNLSAQQKITHLVSDKAIATLLKEMTGA